MRALPVPVLRALAVLVAAASLVVAQPASPATAVDPTPPSAVDELKSAEAELAALTEQARSARDAVTAAVTRYEQAQGQVAWARGVVVSAGRRVDEHRRLLDEQRHLVGERAQKLYISGGTPAVLALANTVRLDGELPSAAIDIALERVGAEDRQRLEILAALERQATAATSDARTALDVVKGLENDVADQTEALRRDAEERSAALTAALDRVNRAIARVQAEQREAARRLAAAQAADAAARAAAMADRTSRLRSLSLAAGADGMNGLLPDMLLCGVGGTHRLRCGATPSFLALSRAYWEHFRVPLCVTDSYRTYAEQVDVYRRKPHLAAVPGTSQHGWGLAVDLCGGIQTFGTPQHEWMRANAARYGWVHPGWAQAGGSKPEAWHWEFSGTP